MTEREFAAITITLFVVTLGMLALNVIGGTL